MGDIYLLECPNGKKYVGQTVKYLNSGKKWGYLARWNAHINEAKRCLNYCRLLDNAIRKYGYENFKLTLICECSTFSELNDKEKYFIKELNTLSPNGYNLTSGGNECHIQSEETCRKKSESLKGKNLGRVLEKRKRKNPEDNVLPKYIRRIKDGYRISNHPSKLDVTFRSKKISMEEKLNFAIEKLKSLNDGMQFID